MGRSVGSNRLCFIFMVDCFGLNYLALWDSHRSFQFSVHRHRNGGAKCSGPLGELQLHLHTGKYFQLTLHGTYIRATTHPWD